MKNLIFVLAICILQNAIISFQAFSQGTWTQKANFGSTERDNAVGFSIGNKGYVGTGMDVTTTHKKDFWEYDPSTNTWTQKADFGGHERNASVGFSIGNKGYVGTGNYFGTYYKDFWEYDPSTNIWTQKADFGGLEATDAVGFSIDNKGYVGIGWSNNGFWEYNPSTDTWTQKADFGGTARFAAVGFSIGNKGYIGTGEDGGSLKLRDFWEYDPAIDIWTQKADFGGTARKRAVGFSIGSKGYIGTGYDGTYKNDLWEYNPSTDTWTQKTNFSGTERFGAVGFSIGNKGYIGTGRNGNNTYKKDFWEYDPGPQIINWIGFYNNIPNNPDIIPDSKELWAGQTNSTPLPPVKICADGSNATLIKFKNNTAINNEDLKFVIESYNTSLNIDLSGEFKSEDYSYNEDTIIARYSHPTYLDVESLFREDKIQIIDISNNDYIIFEYPIQVYRAPVLMVHGLWGKVSTFEDMESELINSGYYNDKLITRANYEPTNSLSYSENANVIKEHINQAFLLTREWNYSAGKVDVVAHSMGGVLSRLYLQNDTCSQSLTTNCYRQDIHKLITIGTPHSGTQSANLLLSPEQIGLQLAVNTWLQFQFPLSFKTIWNGAVKDLQVDSESTINDLNGNSLNYNVVPSHVVISESDFSNAFSWTSLLGIAAQSADMLIDEFLLYLYYDVPSDLVVPINSEDGGMSSSFVSHFYSQIHLGQASNNDIIDEIKIALNHNPTNNNYFSHSGFSPETLTSHFKAGPLGVLPLELADGSIDIISPNYGDSFNAGDIIQVSVTGSSNISKIIFTAFSSSFNNDVFITDTTQLSSVIFEYQIPLDSYGMSNIMVFGFDSDEFVAYDSLSINVNTTANLDSITYDPKRMFLAMGQKKSISLTGYFDDGIQRNLSYIDEVQYSILDTIIAKYVNSNVIEGKNSGNTILTINYQNQTIEIPIEVYYADNWVIGIIENPQWGKSYGQSIIKNLKVYPNPSNNIVTIDYDLLENAFVKLEVFNLFGNSVSIKINEKQLKAKHSYQIDLRDFKTGVYFYTLTANNSIRSGKLIIMK